MQTLLNPGERYITEEWTYCSITAACLPYGIHAVPVAMDKDGMSPAALRKILAEWDSVTQGKRYVRILAVAAAFASFVYTSPHVMYTVPIGQNPVGSVGVLAIYSDRDADDVKQTMGAARKKEIYDICVEYG